MKATNWKIQACHGPKKKIKAWIFQSPYSVFLKTAFLIYLISFTPFHPFVFQSAEQRRKQGHVMLWSAVQWRELKAVASSVAFNDTIQAAHAHSSLPLSLSGILSCLA